jgi:hypothetical protein
VPPWAQQAIGVVQAADTAFFAATPDARALLDLLRPLAGRNPA